MKIKAIVPRLALSSSLLLIGLSLLAQYSSTTSDLNKNWVVTKIVNYDGTVKVLSKQYFDNLGRETQTQMRSTAFGQVLASQVIYDANGRSALTTMVAPLNTSNFGYNANFVLNPNGTPYTYLNFDDNKTDFPDQVGGQNTAGTLGWYYSNNNTMELRVPTSTYPYSRTDFYKDGSGMAKRSAGIGDAFHMGTGKEMSNCKTPVVSELNHYLQVRNKFFSVAEIGEQPSSLSGFALQSVTKDVNGKEIVNFLDVDGKVLMSATPGNDLTVSNIVTLAGNSTYPFRISATSTYNAVTFQSLSGAADINVYSISYSGTYTGIYNGPASGWALPSGGNGQVVVESSSPFSATYQVNDGFGNITTYTNVPSTLMASVFYFKILADNTSVSIAGSYSLYDMATEQSTTLLAGNKLNKGYYKIVANSSTNWTTLTYSNSFTDISYNFYNQLGQLVASIAPEGVKRLIQNINAYNTRADIPFATLLEYDTRGHLVASTSADNGRTEFMYRKDGRLRFSQNAVQRSLAQFSYVNLDQYGRIIESGEFTPAGGNPYTFNSSSLINILDATDQYGGFLQTAGTKSDWTKTTYDYEDNSHGQSGYTQTFLRGHVATTEGADGKSWYSYDEAGKIKWTIKWVNGLGYKTIDYEFDNDGKKNKTVYQKNVSAETFVHYYKYDADGRLSEVLTNTADLGVNDASTMSQAKYYYYVHGPLKRIELAGNMQGLDYTYTLDGKLKGINHSDVTKDPGIDGPANGFLQDAFGELLEYYNNDYVRSGTNIGNISINASDAPEQFGGSIRGFSWFSAKPSGSGASANPTMYVFKYDNKSQFAEATWGSISVSSFVPQTGANKETISSYDLNGNIQNLTRTDNNNNSLNYSYTYQQAPKPNNQLVTVTEQNASQVYANYEYNALGQLTKELPGPAYGSSVNKYIQYDVTGKVIAVFSDISMTTPLVRFTYDEMGKRVKKLSYNGGILQNTTYYVYDATGTLVSVYTQQSGGSIVQREIPVYGGGDRVGVFFKSSNAYRYELTDHLGSVRAVFYKTVSNNINMVVYRDYYPFGMVIPGREYADADNYRYGYQGEYSEKDAETGWNSFELRMYDSKIGKWLSVDPEGQYWSPYVGMGNDPVNRVDPNGGCDNPPCDDEKFKKEAHLGEYRYQDGYAYEAAYIDGGYNWMKWERPIFVEPDPRERWTPKFWERYTHHKPIIAPGEEGTNYAFFAERWKKEEDIKAQWDKITMYFVGGIVLFPVALEAGAATIGTNYGRKLAVEFVKETIANKGDFRKNDYFDIFVDAGTDGLGFVQSLGVKAVTSSIDVDFDGVKVVGVNKSVSVAATQFSVSSLQVGLDASAKIMSGGFKPKTEFALDMVFKVADKAIEKAF